MSNVGYNILPNQTLDLASIQQNQERVDMAKRQEQQQNMQQVMALVQQVIQHKQTEKQLKNIGILDSKGNISVEGLKNVPADSSLDLSGFGIPGSVKGKDSYEQQKMIMDLYSKTQPTSYTMPDPTAPGGIRTITTQSSINPDIQQKLKDAINQILGIGGVSRNVAPGQGATSSAITQQPQQATPSPYDQLSSLGLKNTAAYLSSSPQGQEATPTVSNMTRGGMNMGIGTPDSQAYNLISKMGGTPQQPAVMPQQPSPTTAVMPPQQTLLPGFIMEQTGGKSKLIKMPTAATGMSISSIIPNYANMPIDEVKTTLKQKDPAYYNYLEKVGKADYPIRGAFGRTYNQVTQDVGYLFPDYDPTLYPAKEKLREDFTTGFSSKTLVSLNTALHHADVAYNQIKVLDNGQFKRLNSLGNILKQESGDPRVDVLNTTLSFLNRETPKAIAAGIVTNEDKEAFNRNLNSAQSKEVATSVIDDYINLLGGRTQPKFEQWQQAFGDFKKFPVMGKSALKILEKHGFSYDVSTGELSQNSTAEISNISKTKAQRANEIYQKNPNLTKQQIINMVNREFEGMNK